MKIPVVLKGTNYSTHMIYFACMFLLCCSFCVTSAKSIPSSEETEIAINKLVNKYNINDQSNTKSKDNFLLNLLLSLYKNDKTDTKKSDVASSQRNSRLNVENFYSKNDNDDSNADNSEQKSEGFKRSLRMKMYYNAVMKDDGSFVLIPKDFNRGHYFIG